MAQVAEQTPAEQEDDWTWMAKTTFGSGIAKAIVTFVMTHTGNYDGGRCLGLNFDLLAKEFEFTEKQLRRAVDLLVMRGHARITPQGDHWPAWPQPADHVLVLLTPGLFRMEERARQRKAQQEAERAKRRAEKIAARGGQVNRAKIPDVLRARVYARDDFKCQRCGATENLTLDHIHPWSIGGPDTEENLRVLCRPCNSSKGDRI